MLPSKRKFLRFFGAVDPKGLPPRRDVRVSSWPKPPPSRPYLAFEQPPPPPGEPDPTELPFLRREYYVWAESGQPVGPVSIDQIARGILSGRVPLQAYVTRPGDARWQKVLDMPQIVRALELASALESTDPLEGDDDDADAHGEPVEIDVETDSEPHDTLRGRSVLDSADLILEPGSIPDDLGEAIERASERYLANDADGRHAGAQAEANDVRGAHEDDDDDDSAGTGRYAAQRASSPSHAPAPVDLYADDDAGTGLYDASEAGTGRYEPYVSDEGEHDGSADGTGPYASSAERTGDYRAREVEAFTGELDARAPSELDAGEEPAASTEAEPDVGTGRYRARTSSVPPPLGPPVAAARELPPEDEIRVLGDDPVTVALANALSRAADEGRWDVVLELARKLEVRRPAAPAPDSTVFFLASAPPKPSN